MVKGEFLVLADHSEQHDAVLSTSATMCCCCMLPSCLDATVLARSTSMHAVNNALSTLQDTPGPAHEQLQRQQAQLCSEPQPHPGRAGARPPALWQAASGLAATPSGGAMMPTARSASATR